MTYDDFMGGYVMSNEIYGIGNNTKRHSQMLFWDGDMKHRIEHMDRLELKNIEGITPIHYGDKDGILIVSDDGNKLKNKKASYMILNYKPLTN